MRLSDYVTHLRLPFQFLLSPIFLWGYLLADGKPTAQLIIAYLSFHLFLYAGTTALNSAYDRDEGPVGGLEQPPPVPPHLLVFSIIWQLLGFLLALTINLWFALIYAIIFWMSVGYSHPRVRWKGHPFAALATIAIGQGVLPFLAGWAVARGEIFSAMNSQAILGALTATLLIVGMYPLTQIYQLEEDARRGDKTVALYLGVRGSFRFAAACIAIGGLGAVAIAAARFSMIEAAALVLFIAGLLAWLRRWARVFDAQTIVENFRALMRVYAATTLPFLFWIIFHLALG